MLLNSGVNPQTNATIIPRTTFDLATSAISVANNKGSTSFSLAGYGLGWVRMSYRGHEVSFSRLLISTSSHILFQLVWHNGGAPGVATIVDLYPNDGFGVVILANTRGVSVTRNIALAVADRILGLPKLDHVAKELGPEPQPQTRPHPAPPQIFSGFTGAYSNLGYGNFTLCSSLFPTSRECLEIIRDFRTVDAAAGNPTHSVDLYSAWPRFWGSHLRLSPVSGNDYIAKLTTLYVDGYGSDHTPFEDVSDEIMSATFMVEDGNVVGLGLFVAGGQSWRVKKGGSVREIADVWFDKL